MNDVIKETRDLTYLKWTRTRQSSGTAGSFLKSYETVNGIKLYYKLSDFDIAKGIVGHECVNEVIVQRLMEYFGTPHLSYTLINADVIIADEGYNTWVCVSEDFKKMDEKKIALEDYFEMQKENNESPIGFIKRMNWQNDVYKMLYTDYLTDNRDRHGANIEVLRSPSEKTIRLAPFFDQGLSFLCRCHTVAEVNSYDISADRRIQSFFGSTYAKDNLSLIPKQTIKALCKKGIPDREDLFEGLSGILDEVYYDTIYELIRRRYEYVRSL